MWKVVFMCIALALACDDNYITTDDSYITTGEEVISLWAEQQQQEDAVVPLEGLDPVLLTQGKEAQGDEQFSVRRGRFRYLFASAETKAAFEKEPGRYEIQLGGTCARMGPSVQGNPDLFSVHEGRLYVFGSEACVKLFKATPEKYLEGNAIVDATVPTEETLRRGRALIEKAVEAVGGAARVDKLTSYQEKGTVSVRTQQGVTEIKTSLLVLYPDKVRQERTFPFGTIATVVTSASGFFVLPRGTGDLLEEQRADFEKQLMRGLLPILRARRSEGFKAVAAGAGKVGEATVEQVDVVFNSVRVRLGIDPATGRILNLAYRGRRDSGEFGNIVRTFSDYRSVGGLTLPFKTTGTFNGEAEPSQTSTVEAIIINGELALSLFEKPKPTGGE